MYNVLNGNKKIYWFAVVSIFWQNKRVWITGASSGIGEALARQLARKGALLVLSARGVEKLEVIKAQLPNSEQHLIIPLDVSNSEEIRATVATHASLLGKIDVLINNAGISQRALTWEASAASERLVMETNFFGAIALSKAVLPGMLSRNSGQIINMSSVVGKFGFPLRSTYAASKHALHGYFDSLRAEVQAAGKNLHIMLVCPGRIATNISLSAVVADGSRQNEMDPGLAAGLSPEYCARRIISAAEGHKAELYIGKEQFLIYLKRFLPALFRKVVSHIKPK